MRTIVCTVAAAALAAMAAPATWAGTRAFDAGMKPITAHYGTIHRALAGDRTDGVRAAARKIAKLARQLEPERVTGKHARHYAGLPDKIRSAATRLARARSLKAQRAAFKQLSRPLAMWATMSQPAGISVVYCSMARGSWLQRDKTIANPYYGASMLRCGEVVSGAHKGRAGGHMKH